MANKILTTFQDMSKVFNGAWSVSNGIADLHTEKPKDEVVFKTTDPEEYKQKKLELQQNKYLENRWKKVNQNLSISAFNGLSNVKLMYMDADLMDSYPEIGAALDLISEECVVTTGSRQGMVVNVSSKSDRIKSILEDLFVNRLNLQVTAQMVIRAMCKYGNQFMLLDIDKNLGVKGWRQLPVGEVQRIENGIINPYGGGSIATNTTDVAHNDLSTQFLWQNELGGDLVPFRNWQVAHFRLLHNSMYLPYGVSCLAAGRRHFRMLALMEDMMLIYRLERSMERRIYKIYVGGLDDEDIGPYIDKIADQFKRTPIVDPMTGQLDLRKNILCATDDYFIPTRTEGAASPIETLSGAKNLDAIDDIKYIQKKLCAALRIPQSFLNFEEATGDGKNLALQDVRFARTVNRYQQAFLMELTKIATIHLYLLGFEEDLTNFNLTMNNPSTQAEQLEIENIQKQLSAVRDAVSDPGNGIPVMSLQRAQKEILKWSDKDIKENLEEIRLEKALAAELENTSQIIKRTGIFDMTDRIYGEPGAEYQEAQGGGPGDGGPGGGGFPGGGGGDFGGGLDMMGAPGGDEGMTEPGMEAQEPTEDMNGGGNAPDMGGEPAGSDNEQPKMESRRRKKPLITENGKKRKKSTKKETVKQITESNIEAHNKRTNQLFEKLIANMESKSNVDEITTRVDIYNKTLRINEDFENVLTKLDEFRDNNN